MSRIKPGRPAKGEWARAMSTAEPGLVYSWYFDIKFRCTKKPGSPTTKPIEFGDTQQFEGNQTIYLGAFETVEFRTLEVPLRADRLAEWQKAHPECLVVEVYESYRHYRGSSP